MLRFVPPVTPTTKGNRRNDGSWTRWGALRSLNAVGLSLSNGRRKRLRRKHGRAVAVPDFLKVVSPLPLTLGGQAVYEGVMLRSPRYCVVAVRSPDGAIAVHSEPLTERASFWRLPLLRGAVALYDALALGLRAMRLSLEMALPNEAQKVAEPRAFAWQAAAGFALALGLFVVLPHWVAAGAAVTTARWQLSLLEGLLRLFFFGAYLWFLGRLPDAQRLFAYHGAEHKAVHAFENNAPLTVSGLKPFPTEHPRCGTAFLLFVLLVKVVLFAFLPVGGWQGVCLRLAMLPVVAGLSFELLRLGAQGRWGRWLTIPGLWLQKLTTREPDDRQLEVAAVALQELLRLEGIAVAYTPAQQHRDPV